MNVLWDAHSELGKIVCALLVCIRHIPFSLCSLICASTNLYLKNRNERHEVCGLRSHKNEGCFFDSYRLPCSCYRKN